MSKVKNAIIRQMAKEIREFNDVHHSDSGSYLAAGLAVLSRDMYYYLSSHPRSDAKLFQDMIPSVIKEEKKYYDKQHSGSKEGFPYDDRKNPNLDAVSNLPIGIVEAAAQGRIDISALYTENIVHEWTRHTGLIFFRKFRSKFKGVICGKGGPYEQFNNGRIKEAYLPTAIVVDVAKNGFSDDTIWIPLTVYFGALLVKKGLKVYCEGTSLLG